MASQTLKHKKTKAKPIHNPNFTPGARTTQAPKSGTSINNQKRPFASSAKPLLPSAKSHKINTDTTSYDRKDPFLALNTLFKLFSSLPSRVIAGTGCHHKILTLEEHKTSLHLLNIIEPFVGLAPTKRSCFIRQPTEIIDAIISFVEAKQDLLNLGLSCKRLADIIFPRHWEYRVIRAKLSSVAVWKHLSERRDLVKNVRILEVLDERSDQQMVIPRVLQANRIAAFSKKSRGPVLEVISTSSSDDDSSISSFNNGLSMHDRQEKYFIAALAKMTRLVELKWQSNHSPISVLADGDIWSTIMGKCAHSLRQLEVVDNMVFAPLHPNTEGSDAGRWDRVVEREAPILYLRSATLRGTQYLYGASKDPNLDRLSVILHQCPYLEQLEVTYRVPKNGLMSLPAANELLAYGRWSQLKSLTLSNLASLAVSITTSAEGNGDVMNTEQYNPLQDFLFAHPALEVLKLLNVGPLRRMRLRSVRNLLPKLRELHAGRDVVSMVLRSECDTPRPLETIKGFRMPGISGFGAKDVLTSPVPDHPRDTVYTNDNPSLEFYRYFRKARNSIRRVELDGWNDLNEIRMLATCIPKLNWLDVGKKLKPGNNSGTVPFSTTMPKGNAKNVGPVTNTVEWADALSSFEELTTLHGIRFLYEVPQQTIPYRNGSASNELSNGGGYSNGALISAGPGMSMTDRSKIKKNDEIASVLAWKCKKLRRIDHWDGETSGKVIVLLRDASSRIERDSKVRWDVRKLKRNE